MVVVNISEFKQPFRFERFVKTANTSGGSTEEFELICNTRGKWEKLDGSRNLTEGQDQIITVYKVTCYWRSNLENVINKDTRLIYDNRVFRIERKDRVGEVRQYYQFFVSEAH